MKKCETIFHQQVLMYSATVLHDGEKRNQIFKSCDIWNNLVAKKDAWIQA